jgi:hypothetical protein
MADDAGIRLEEQILQRGQRTFELQERLLSDEGALSSRRQPVANSHNDFWRSADWLLCRDGKYRPVEPGTFPLAHGVAARGGKLRAYGNAIVPQVAEEVIRAYLDAHP